MENNRWTNKRFVDSNKVDEKKFKISIRAVDILFKS